MSMEKLRTYYFGLYGENGITQFFFDQLVGIMETAKAGRSAALRKQDKKGNDWYLSEKMVGMMLYLDKFSEDLINFREKNRLPGRSRCDLCSLYAPSAVQRGPERRRIRGV